MPLDLGTYASDDAGVDMLKGITKIQAITRGKHMRENEVKLYHNDNDSMPDLVDASVTAPEIADRLARTIDAMSGRPAEGPPLVVDEDT